MHYSIAHSHIREVRKTRWWWCPSGRGGLPGPVPVRHNGRLVSSLPPSVPAGWLTAPIKVELSPPSATATTTTTAATPKQSDLKLGNKNPTIAISPEPSPFSAPQTHQRKNAGRKSIRAHVVLLTRSRRSGSSGHVGRTAAAAAAAYHPVSDSLSDLNVAGLDVFVCASKLKYSAATCNKCNE